MLAAYLWGLFSQGFHLEACMPDGLTWAERDARSHGCRICGMLGFLVARSALIV